MSKPVAVSLMPKDFVDDLQDELRIEGFDIPEHWKMLDMDDAKNWECSPLTPVVDGIIAEGTLTLIAAATR